MNIHDALEYELDNSWIAQYVCWGWAQRLTGRYYAWKVKRKVARHIREKAIRAALRAAGLLQTTP